MTAQPISGIHDSTHTRYLESESVHTAKNQRIRKQATRFCVDSCHKNWKNDHDKAKVDSFEVWEASMAVVTPRKITQDRSQQNHTRRFAYDGVHYHKP